MFISKNSKFTIVSFFLLISTFGFADDIEDSVKEGLDFYRKGQYKESIDSLNYATQLMQQKLAAKLEDFLPKPLSGWKVKKTTSQGIGGAMFGGGAVAENHYTKGNSSMEIQIITNSPLVASISMMMSNPMFATADGGKLTKIKGQKGVMKYNSQSKYGELQILVDNRILILFEGENIKESELKDYANAVDYDKLKKME